MRPDFKVIIVFRTAAQLDERQIFRHGRKYWSADLTERICGGPIQVTPFVNYMKAKFSDVYGL